MSKTVEIAGTLTCSDGCCTGGQFSSPNAIDLGLGPKGCASALFYQSAIRQDGVQVQTQGVVGDQFVDLDCLDGFDSIELLYLRSSAPVQLRLSPTRPEAVSVGAVPPTGFAAGVLGVRVRDEVGVEYLATVDFSVTPAADRAAVVAALNGALGALGTPTPPGAPVVALNADNGLTVTSPGLGPLSLAELQDAGPILGGTVTQQGAGFDEHPRTGLQVYEFERSPNAPTKIQISGTAVVDIFAAGRTS